jgi:hypothetical protein
LDELQTGAEDLIITAYNTDLEKWRMEDRLCACLGSRKCKLQIVHVPGPARGAAETVNIALGKLTEEERGCKVLLCDCDSFYRYDVVNAFRVCTTNMSVVYRDEGPSTPTVSLMQG